MKNFSLFILLVSGVVFGQVKTKEQLIDDYKLHVKNSREDLAASKLNIAELLYGTDEDMEYRKIYITYLILKDDQNYRNKEMNDTFLATLAKHITKTSDAKTEAQLRYMRADYSYNVLRKNYGSKDYPTEEMTKIKTQSIEDAKIALKSMNGNEILTYIIEDLERQTLY